ncbi:MAG: class II fructose-bisphosphate aldolase [bacterium]|nr:class II fructose-bisphosphate aldolase [bacterium]
MSFVDTLVYQAHFGTPIQQTQAAVELRTMAREKGIVPSSLYKLYRARGKEQIPSNFTVPAMNLRGLSYLTAQAAFTAAQKSDTGLFIFELARSEMRYTAQNPEQLVSSVLAAALNTNWNKPVFIQADHVQPKAASPGIMKEGEKAAISDLIRECLDAGIYNIDLDGSTLVNPDEPTEYDQQRSNFTYTAEFVRLITEWQPAGVTPAIGFEVSEVGTHLSKSSQIAAFMTGFSDVYSTIGKMSEFFGFTKVAIETGTKHGGTVNRDGTPGPMLVDFERLQTLSLLARHKYGMAGAVQHGASTLSKDIFTKFPEYEAAEIHLSTGFQNLIMDHPYFPQDLIAKMYKWCDLHCSTDKRPDQSAAQFYVKTRKKAWGAYKEESWKLPPENLQHIKDSLENECLLYFESLNVTNTQNLLLEFV